MDALVKTTYTREGELISEEIIGYVDGRSRDSVLAEIFFPLIKSQIENKKAEKAKETA